MKYQPTVLIIRDGWGANHQSAHDSFNAVKLAQTPVADHIAATYPRTEIEACGLSVGLPEGIMGNSEVGHQNLGAGRIVDQELLRLNKGFSEKTVKRTEVFQKIVEQGKTGGRVHLMGIVSDAGVHGMLEHLYGLVTLLKEEGVKEVFLHAFTDGRDTPPFSGKGYVEEVEKKFAEIGLGTIASVTGRYWAMDRDLRWDRVKTAYDCITGKSTVSSASAVEAIQSYYDQPAEGMKGDEFIPATRIDGVDGTVRDGDAVLFYNYRGDRPRELTRAFIEDDFTGFDRGAKLDILYVTMTEYQKDLCEHVLFRKPAPMKNILGSIVSDRGIPQFRCAETEKFPHVTFFFNDYREEPFPLEEREIIQSPKDCNTYDEKPEMSAEGVCQATEAAIRSQKYGLIIVNFANPDMVGHTGSLPAAITACETVDACVGRLLKALEDVGGQAIVTADHGNCDQMYSPEIDGAHTSHTLNPVEVVLVGEKWKDATLRTSGILGDIAPTMLEMMGLAIPEEMTGKSLLSK